MIEETAIGRQAEAWLANDSDEGSSLLALLDGDGLLSPAVGIGPFVNREARLVEAFKEGRASASFPPPPLLPPGQCAAPDAAAHAADEAGLERARAFAQLYDHPGAPVEKLTGEPRRVAALRGLDELEALRNLDRTAAIEAVAALRGDPARLQLAALGLLEKRDEAEAALSRVRAVRGVVHSADQLRDELSRRARAFPRQPAEGQASRTLSGSLPDAPLAEVLEVPDGWEVGPKGVFEIMLPKGDAPAGAGPALRPVASAPVVIAGRAKDVNSGAIRLRLAFLRDGRWVDRVVPRERMADARSIVAEARYDLPVNSNNARQLVSYLMDFEAHNLAKFPCTRISTRMGWQGTDGALGFLLGNRVLCAPTGAPPAADGAPTDCAEDWREDGVTFEIEDDATARLASAYQSAGTFEGWRAAVQTCTQFPRVMLALYAALVPPIMEAIPSAENFVVSWAGTTSAGKTTALMVGASCWGLPKESRETGVLGTWDTSVVGFERTFQALNNLPVFADDTKRARDHRDIPKVIYDFCSGCGRQRGSTEGLRSRGQWRSTLLTTGEGQLVGSSQDGGTRARVIETFGPPFGETTSATGAVVNDLRRGLLENYGHAGPRFVEWLGSLRGSWHLGAADFATRLEFWRNKAGEHPVASRVASYFAMLELAGANAHLLFGLEGDVRENLEVVWEQAKGSFVEADPAVRALKAFRGWAASRAASFWGRHGGALAPIGGWLGAWPGEDGWPHVAVIPSRLEVALRELGFDPSAVEESWRQRGWLEEGEGKHGRKKVTVHQDRTRCVVIRRAAFVEVGEDDPAGGPETEP